MFFFVCFCFFLTSLVQLLCHSATADRLGYGCDAGVRKCQLAGQQCHEEEVMAETEPLQAQCLGSEYSSQEQECESSVCVRADGITWVVV